MKLRARLLFRRQARMHKSIARREGGLQPRTTGDLATRGSAIRKRIAVVLRNTSKPGRKG